MILSVARLPPIHADSYGFKRFYAVEVCGRVELAALVAIDDFRFDKDLHYGFYGSNYKIRLHRVDDGPVNKTEPISIVLNSIKKTFSAIILLALLCQLVSIPEMKL
jgi:hypothetical protein